MAIKRVIILVLALVTGFGAAGLASAGATAGQGAEQPADPEGGEQGNGENGLGHGDLRVHGG